MSPGDDLAAYMTYGWEDIWSSIPEASRKEWGLFSRNDMDSWASADMFATMFGLNEKDIEMKQYAGMNFGIGWTNQDTSYGINLAMHCAVTFKNSYALTFQLIDLDKEYDDVLYKVLDSIYFD